MGICAGYSLALWMILYNLVYKPFVERQTLLVENEHAIIKRLQQMDDEITRLEVLMLKDKK